MFNPKAKSPLLKAAETVIFLSGPKYGIKEAYPNPNPSLSGLSSIATGLESKSEYKPVERAREAPASDVASVPNSDASELKAGNAPADELCALMLRLPERSASVDK